MKKMFFGLFLAALCLPFSVDAMTAVCKDPKGRILGILGKDQRRVDEADGMTGGIFSFAWERGAKFGIVTAMGTPPSEPETRKVPIVFDTLGQVTFVDVMTSAVWMYSVYPSAKRMILTAHNDGAAGFAGGAVAKVFDAECSISD